MLEILINTVTAEFVYVRYFIVFMRHGFKGGLSSTDRYSLSIHSLTFTSFIHFQLTFQMNLVEVKMNGQPGKEEEIETALRACANKVCIS